ncbi:hypothetical protein [uncultured Desulfobacter sp.]|uniref:hypothetical protein n=1 Tax=uncultured Desulfobacter sp. TaxID=240139 RepID=UPI0029F51C02|nr:hypothetical protein [uncultured Desulfobacter sp.]
MKRNLIYLGLKVTAFLLLLFFLIPAGCGFNTVGRMKHSPALMEQYREKTFSKQLS